MTMNFFIFFFVNCVWLNINIRASGPSRSWERLSFAVRAFMIYVLWRLLYASTQPVSEHETRECKLHRRHRRWMQPEREHRGKLISLIKLSCRWRWVVSQSLNSVQIKSKKGEKSWQIAARRARRRRWNNVVGAAKLSTTNYNGTSASRATTKNVMTRVKVIEVSWIAYIFISENKRVNLSFLLFACQPKKREISSGVERMEVYLLKS